MRIIANPTATKTAESLIASSLSFSVAHRTFRSPRSGTDAVALEPDRPAVADEEARNQEEHADDVERDGERAIRVPASEQR